MLDIKINNTGQLIYNKDFDAEIIKKKLLLEFEYDYWEPSLYIIILELRENSNSDDFILKATKMYIDDFELNEKEYLDIVADEAIFRRLIRARAQWPYLRPLLGQWHTSKDFCSVLLVLFSNYGLLNLAHWLGVHFLDKLEAAIDYRSTARVLDLVWITVGIAINIYIKKKNIQINQIMDENNNSHIFLKVWYLYYRWAGI